MAFDLWFWFLVVEVWLSLVPGPAVLFVVAQGLRHGARLSFAASCGILLANACYFGLSALGLASMFAATPGLLEVLRWGGVLYVGWLGVQSLRSRGLVAKDPSPGQQPTTTAANLLRRGFLVQIGNPKALLFFASILPGFVDTSATAWPPWLQLLVFGITSVGSEVWVLFGYGALAASASARMREPVFARNLDRATGVLLLAVALWLSLRSASAPQ